MTWWDVVWTLGALWLALAAGLLVYGLNIGNRWRHRHFPGPPPAWLIGNMARNDNPHMIGPQGKSYIALQRWAKTYGPCFVFFLGRQPTIVLSDPELIREAGLRGFKVFHDRPVPKIQTGPPHDVEFQNSSIIAAKGKYWRGVRAACEPLFHRAALESYAPPMNQAVDRLLARLGPASGGDMGVNVSEVLNGLTMDVIGNTAFGVELQAQEGGEGPNPMLEAAQVFFKPFGGIGPLMATLFFGFPHIRQTLGWLALRMRAPRILALCEARALLWGATQQLLDNARKSACEGESVGDQVATQAGVEASGGDHGSAVGEGRGETSNAPPPTPGSVEERQARAFARGRQLYRNAEPPLRSSIIHMLRNAKNHDTGAPLRDMEICSQLFTFLLAGYETTSLALGYTLYEVARQPALQERLRAEVAALGLPGRGAAIEFQHLDRLPLTEATFSEALRMYPPASPFVAMAREALQATAVGAYAVPKGSTVVFNVWGLHYNPKHYPDPEVFRPERFLPDSEESRERHPQAYLPFGVGPRKCVGYKFALEEGVLVLARLVDQFEFELDPEHHQGPLDLVMGITISPRGGIWLRVKHRT